jgi:hypothetical protein
MFPSGDNGALRAYYESVDKRHSRSINFSAFIVILVLGVVGFIYYDAQIRSSHTPSAPRIVERTVIREVPSKAAPTPAPMRPVSTIHDTNVRVRSTLTQVHAQIKDLNNDGKINCQDYAAMFHRLWPDSDIMYNRHIGPTGHVFIRIPAGNAGGIYFVEPQAKNNDWLMSEQWPNWNQWKNQSVEVTSQYAY